MVKTPNQEPQMSIYDETRQEVPPQPADEPPAVKEVTISVPPTAQKLLDAAADPYSQQETRIRNLENGSGVSTYAAKLRVGGDKLAGASPDLRPDKSHKPSSTPVYGSSQREARDNDKKAESIREQQAGERALREEGPIDEETYLKAVEAAKRYTIPPKPA